MFAVDRQADQKDRAPWPPDLNRNDSGNHNQKGVLPWQHDNDVFDIAAAGKTHRREIVQALAGYPGQVSVTITALESANPEYVLSVIEDLRTKPDFESLKETAIEECLAILRSALLPSR